MAARQARSWAPAAEAAPPPPLSRQGSRTGSESGRISSSGQRRESEDADDEAKGGAARGGASFRAPKRSSVRVRGAGPEADGDDSDARPNGLHADVESTKLYLEQNARSGIVRRMSASATATSPRNAGANGTAAAVSHSNLRAARQQLMEDRKALRSEGVERVVQRRLSLQGADVAPPSAPASGAGSSTQPKQQQQQQQQSLASSASPAAPPPLVRQPSKLRRGGVSVILPSDGARLGAGVAASESSSTSVYAADASGSAPRARQPSTRRSERVGDSDDDLPVAAPLPLHAPPPPLSAPRPGQLPSKPPSIVPSTATTASAAAGSGSSGSSSHSGNPLAPSASATLASPPALPSAAAPGVAVGAANRPPPLSRTMSLVSMRRGSSLGEMTDTHLATAVSPVVPPAAAGLGNLHSASAPSGDPAIHLRRTTSLSQPIRGSPGASTGQPHQQSSDAIKLVALEAEMQRMHKKLNEQMRMIGDMQDRLNEQEDTIHRLVSAQQSAGSLRWVWEEFRPMDRRPFVWFYMGIFVIIRFLAPIVRSSLFKLTLYPLFAFVYRLVISLTSSAARPLRPEFRGQPASAQQLHLVSQQQQQQQQQSQQQQQQQEQQQQQQQLPSLLAPHAHAQETQHLLSRQQQALPLHAQRAGIAAMSPPLLPAQRSQAHLRGSPPVLEQQSSPPKTSPYADPDRGHSSPSRRDLPRARASPPEPGLSSAVSANGRATRHAGAPRSAKARRRA